MALRKVTATWTPSSHALVHFSSDNTIVIVPIRRITQTDSDVLKKGDKCSVKWTDGVQYEATVKALGSAEQMQAIQDSLLQSDSDESSEEKVDDEPPKDSTELDDVALEGAARKKGKATVPKKTALRNEASRVDEELMKNVPLLASPQPESIDATFKSTVLQKLSSIESFLKKHCEENEGRKVQGVRGSPAEKRSPAASVYLYNSPVSSPEAQPTTALKEELGKGGCWLGNPHSHIQENKKVWIPKGDMNRVSMAEAISTNATRLSVNLLTVFFTKEQLASGNCTPAPNRQLLDPSTIQGIRLHINYRYPVADSEEETRWKKLLHTNLNSKCRNVRASLLAMSKGSSSSISATVDQSRCSP